jgi:hypothetical protein
VKWRLAFPLAGLLACRFGGPTSNAYQYTPSPDAATKDASVSKPPPSGDDGAFPTGNAGDALTGADSTGAPADDDAGDLDAVFGGDAEEGGCSSTVAVCDPIHNTGCNVLQQCDVNTLVTSPPTGLCVFNSGSTEGGACIASIVSESCSPKSTCVDGVCRQLCFCNADCPAGQCCSDTSGPPGFTLCRPCP